MPMSYKELSEITLDTKEWRRNLKVGDKVKLVHIVEPNRLLGRSIPEGIYELQEVVPCSSFESYTYLQRECGGLRGCSKYFGINDKPPQCFGSGFNSHKLIPVNCKHKYLIFNRRCE